MSEYPESSDSYVPHKYRDRDQHCRADDCEASFFMAISRELHYLREHAES